MAKETTTGAPGSAEDQVTGEEQTGVDEEWNIDGELPESMKPDTKKKAAVPKPAKKEPGEEPPPAEEGEEEEEPVEEEGAEEAEPSEEEAQPTEREIELERQVAEMNAQMGQFQQMLEYYQGIVNQGVSPPGQAQPGQPQPQTTVPGQPGAAQPQQPPEGVLAPGQWDSSDWAKAQDDMGRYFDWRSQSVVQEQLQTAYQQAIQPIFQAIGQQLGAIREQFVRSQHKDYDDIVKAVHQELFYLDPTGRPIAEKNPALIKYFQQAPFPELAMYQWGLSKKAPDRIKEAARKSSAETAKKIASKPKGVTRPKTSGPPSEAPEIDWDSDEQTVEAYLGDKKLI